MLELGKASHKFFTCQSSSLSSARSVWKLKTSLEYAEEHKTTPVISKAYFKGDTLAEVVDLYPMRKSMTTEQRHAEKQERACFLHFLQGLLRWEPSKRWTPLQTAQHPFLTKQNFAHFDEQAFEQLRFAELRASPSPPLMTASPRTAAVSAALQATSLSSPVHPIAEVASSLSSSTSLSSSLSHTLSSSLSSSSSSSATAAANWWQQRGRAQSWTQQGTQALITQQTQLPYQQHQNVLPTSQQVSLFSPFSLPSSAPSSSLSSSSSSSSLSSSVQQQQQLRQQQQQQAQRARQRPSPSPHRGALSGPNTPIAASAPMSDALMAGLRHPSSPHANRPSPSSSLSLSLSQCQQMQSQHRPRQTSTPSSPARRPYFAPPAPPALQYGPPLAVARPLLIHSPMQNANQTQLAQQRRREMEHFDLNQLPEHDESVQHRGWLEERYNEASMMDLSRDHALEFHEPPNPSVAEWDPFFNEDMNVSSSQQPQSLSAQSSPLQAGLSRDVPPLQRRRSSQSQAQVQAQYALQPALMTHRKTSAELAGNTGNLHAMPRQRSSASVPRVSGQQQQSPSLCSNMPQAQNRIPASWLPADPQQAHYGAQASSHSQFHPYQLPPPAARALYVQAGAEQPDASMQPQAFGQYYATPDWNQINQMNQGQSQGNSWMQQQTSSGAMPIQISSKPRPQNLRRGSLPVTPTVQASNYANRSELTYQQQMQLQHQQQQQQLMNYYGHTDQPFDLVSPSSSLPQPSAPMLIASPPHGSARPHVYGHAGSHASSRNPVHASSLIPWSPANSSNFSHFFSPGPHAPPSPLHLNMDHMGSVPSSPAHSQSLHVYPAYR